MHLNIQARSRSILSDIVSRAKRRSTTHRSGAVTDRPPKPQSFSHLGISGAIRAIKGEYTNPPMIDYTNGDTSMDIKGEYDSSLDGSEQSPAPDSYAYASDLVVVYSVERVPISHFPCRVVTLHNGREINPCGTTGGPTGWAWVM